MRYNIILLLTAVLVSLIGCGDTPVFTEMSTNRLKVVIKGTLETEDISNFPSMPTVNGALMQDDSVDDVTTGSADVLPETFMMDIAEIKLDREKFANYRTIIESSLSGDGSSEPFFNGSGIVLKNDDPGEGNYDTVKIYIRKMVFDNAMIYQSTGNTMTYEEPAEVIFHENDVNGFDFNQLQVNSYWDSLREEGGDTLRNFPLRVPIIGGMNYNKDDEETVLEIRLVIKNFVKKYEYDYYDEGIFKACHYFALSDWLRDVRAGENDIGGNIHAVARAYVPGNTARVEVTAPIGNYVFAIPSTEVVTDYVATPPARNFACDLPQAPSYPGEYIQAVLDYYLRYENYKSEWNNSILTCNSLSLYETAWDTYEAAAENFKIPPYVAYSSGGSVVFSNMAPGSYNFYQIGAPAAYGELFSGVPTQIGTTTTITAGQNLSL